MQVLASGVLQHHYTYHTGACFKTDPFNAVLIGGNSRRYERPNMDNPYCRISQAVIARHGHILTSDMGAQLHTLKQCP